MFIMWQVLARFARIQERVDQAHDRRIEQSGYARGYAAGVAETRDARGYAACEAAMKERMPPIFGEHPVYIPVASVQFLGSPPVIGAYEPPDKQTGSIKPVARPDELKRMIGTEHLPAIDRHGRLLQSYLDEQQRKAAGE